MTAAGYPLADFHSHLIPGVDDGAQDMNEALDGVARLRVSGAGAILTTPHLDGSLTMTPDLLEERLFEIDRAWGELTAAVRAIFPDLDLRRGHEVMVDIPHLDLSDPRIRLDGGRFVLVEWPRMQVPPATGDVVARMVADGYVPIIAHPERYHGLDPELDVVRLWRSRGARLQVNHGSLVGRYGHEARAVAFRLLRRGWVDYLSSDFHPRGDQEPMIDQGRDALLAAGGEEQWALLTETNPGRLLAGEEPLLVPPLPREEGVWRRFRKALTGGDV